MSKSVTDRLAEYVFEAKFNEMPRDVIEKAKELILDDVGNALGGFPIRGSKILLKWARTLSCKPESTIIGDGSKTLSCIAAGLNSYMAWATDFMETYRNLGHPGSNIVQTALSLGEREGISGKDVLTAVIVAYEVTSRIINATIPTPKFRRRVWNMSWHVIGSVVAATKVLELNVAEIENAFGIGIGNAPTYNLHKLLYVPASMAKGANFIHCFIGIISAELAKMGFTGHHDILDGDYGYWSTISDVNREEEYTKGLGKEYNLLKYVSLKPWSTCRWAQPGVESLLKIMKEKNLTVNDVEKVVYCAHEKVTSFPYNNTDPKTPEDAYWSVPWAFANAALGYPPGPSWYSDERFEDKRLKEFMKKVELRTYRPAVTAFSKDPQKSVTLLIVKTKEKTYKERTEYCKGDPQRPMTRDELVSKFKSQASQVIDSEKVEENVRIIEWIEDLDNVKELFDLLY